MANLKIGILGGTFDPIHNGHIMVAEEVGARLDLAKVLFVPAGQPWLKKDSPVLAAEHRLQMVRLAISDKPCFQLSSVEVERAGPSYTVDTIAELQAEFGGGYEFFFIVGWDSLAELPRWHEPAKLITMCRLVVVPRPGYLLPRLSSLEAAIPGLSPRVILLDGPEINIEAKEIRERVARGLAIDHLVPAPVARYIKQHKLYLVKEEV